MKKTALFNNTKKMFTRVVATALTVATVFTAVPMNVNASTKNMSDLLISEDNYSQTLENVVVPYTDQFKKTGYITGEKKVKLFYETYALENSKGTVVISHGLGENLDKYDEMIYYYLNMGYSVYAMEHRGHSRSGRLGSDETMVNVESFSYYFKDLKKFLDEVVVPEQGKNNLYLFGHSMGGGIATRFLETYPEYFQAAILSSPMIEVLSGNVPSFFAKLLAHGAAITPWKNKYVTGKGPFNPDYNFGGSHTHSEARYARLWQLRTDNEIYRMGGTSFNWLSESYYATLAARTNASKVKIPVLLFQAGQDTLVGADGQNTFAKRAANCKVVRFENAKHDLYFESNDVLETYYNEVFNFLAAN